MVGQAVHRPLRGHGEGGGPAERAGVCGADEAEGEGSMVAVSRVRSRVRCPTESAGSGQNHGGFPVATHRRP